MSEKYIILIFMLCSFWIHLKCGGRQQGFSISSLLFISTNDTFIKKKDNISITIIKDRYCSYNLRPFWWKKNTTHFQSIVQTSVSYKQVFKTCLAYHYFILVLSFDTHCEQMIWQVTWSGKYKIFEIYCYLDQNFKIFFQLSYTIYH